MSTDPGETVSLECEADGNPGPTYAWFRDGDENKVAFVQGKLFSNRGHCFQVLKTTTELKFVLGPDTAGSYTCRATVKGYKEIRAKARVLMFGPPRILDNSDTSVDTRIGTEAAMTCDSFAIPLPDKV